MLPKMQTKQTILLCCQMLHKKCISANPSYQIVNMNQTYRIISELPERVSLNSYLTLIIFICKLSKQLAEVQRGQIVIA